MTQSPGILFVNDASAYGGAELYQTELARACLARGWRAAVALPETEPLDGWAGNLQEAGVEVFRYRDHGGGDRTFCEQCAAWQADLVHGNGSSHTGFFQMLQAVMNGSGCILTEHSFPYNIPLRCSFPNAIRTRLHRRVWREKHLQWDLCQKLITVNEIYRKVMVKNWSVPSEKIEAIYNGVDPGQFMPRASARAGLVHMIGREVNGPIVMAAGRLEWQKGFDLLIEALAGVKKREWFLVLVGDGACRTDLNRQAKDLGISDRIFMPGYRNDLHEILAGGDIFVLPSRVEAIGFALLEALACFLPVIGSHVGGVPEVLGESEYGLLVPAENVAMLRKAIVRLLDDSVLCETLRRRGRERIQSKFTKQQMIQRTLAIYEGLIERRGE